MDHDPLWARRARGRGGFRSVWLDAVGWSALVGTGLALGVALAASTDAPAAVALPAGVVATWLALLVADRVRWRKGTIGMGRGDLDADAGPAIVARLRVLGIDARYEEVRFDEEDEPQRSIVCRNADADTVRRVMDETLGVPF